MFRVLAPGPAEIVGAAFRRRSVQQLCLAARGRGGEFSARR